MFVGLYLVSTFVAIARSAAFCSSTVSSEILGMERALLMLEFLGRFPSGDEAREEAREDDAEGLGEALGDGRRNADVSMLGVYVREFERPRPLGGSSEFDLDRNPKSGTSLPENFCLSDFTLPAAGSGSAPILDFNGSVCLFDSASSFELSKVVVRLSGARFVFEELLAAAKSDILIFSIDGEVLGGAIVALALARGFVLLL